MTDDPMNSPAVRALTPFQTTVERLWINAEGDLLAKCKSGRDAPYIVCLRTAGGYVDAADPAEIGTPDEWREVELPRG